MKTKRETAANERTRAIYESVKNIPAPPRIPLMPLTADNAFRSLQIRRTRFSEMVLWILATPTGFKKWYKKLPDRLDDVLLNTDSRGAALHAPVVSASLALKDDERELDAIDRAVTLVLGVQSFYKEMSSGTLSPDKYKDSVLEMGQYPNLFSTGLTIEKKVARLYKSGRTNQMTVIVRDQIYLVHIDFTTDIFYSDLKNTLQAIVKDARTETASTTGVGLLTATPQGIQLKAFSRLQKIDENRENVERLRHSFLTLCLDLDDNPKDDAEAMKMAHSGNPKNRWYWASLQLVVFGNAKASAICNFSAYLDGNTMMRGASEIQARAQAASLPEEQQNEQYNFSSLNWAINPIAFIRAQHFYEKFNDEQPATYTINEIGRATFEAHNIDPIAVFVIALKLASDAHLNKPAVIHQFLTMTKYRYMDLVTAIVSTPAVSAFCDYIQKSDFDSVHAKKLLSDAVKSQHDKYRQERKALPLSTAFALFMSEQKDLPQFKNSLVQMLCMYLLQKRGYLKDVKRDIVLSHPAIYENVPLVGRPGAKLPYVSQFALHYQMWAQKTVITMMPGLRWTVDNESFIHQINTTMQTIVDILNEAKEKNETHHKTDEHNRGNNPVH